MRFTAEELSVVIPFRCDSAGRLENLTAVVGNLSATLQGVEIILLEDGPHLEGEALRQVEGLCYHGRVHGGAFHRTRLLNIGMAGLCSRRFVASCDTDVLIYPEAWRQALERLRAGAAMVFPFDGRFFNLRGKVRRDLIARGDLDVVPPERLQAQPRWRGDIVCVNRASVGGCVIFAREVFRDCGGYHQGFVNWGFEDAELVSRMAKFGHLPVRIEELPLLHLAHGRAKGATWYRARRVNKALFHRLRAMSRAELERLIAQGALRVPTPETAAGPTGRIASSLRGILARAGGRR